MSPPDLRFGPLLPSTPSRDARTRGARCAAEAQDRRLRQHEQTRRPSDKERSPARRRCTDGGSGASVCVCSQETFGTPPATSAQASLSACWTAAALRPVLAGGTRRSTMCTRWQGLCPLEVSKGGHARACVVGAARRGVPPPGGCSLRSARPTPSLWLLAMTYSGGREAGVVRVVAGALPTAQAAPSAAPFPRFGRTAGA